MNFGEVKLEDFTTFKAGITLAHVEIEKKLIELGGSGLKGNEFKKECLAKAGWKYGKLTSYGAYPEVATEAFTKLKEVLESLESVEDKEVIIQKLSS